MTEYRIITEDVVIQAEHVQSDPDTINNRTRGEKAEFNFLIDDLNQLVVASGETHTVDSEAIEAYSSADIDGTLVIDGTLLIRGLIDNDGSIDNNGTLIIKDTGTTQFDGLLRYDRHAGSYALMGELDTTQRYKERLPTSPNVSSLVVGLEPADNLESDEIAGKWGLINNIEDNRTRAFTNPVLTIEIDILADYSEFTDVNEVQTNLEI